MRNLTVLVGVLAASFFLTGPVAAQYPGTTSTTAAATPPSVTSQSSGTLAVGATAKLASCGLRPGQVSVGVNGRTAAADAVEADGCARTEVAVLSAAQVRVEGVLFSASCGTGSNTLSVAGSDPAGVPRVVNTVFGVACPVAATGGLLPRTGALVLRWSLLGAALVAVGALLVLENRRQPAAAATSTQY